jgi:hypothetical protein
MHENPYSSPRTSGNERRDTPRRPPSVKLAAACIVCTVLTGQAKFFFIDMPITGVLAGLAFTVVLGVAVLVIAAVLSRMNWARWVVAALLTANLSLFPGAIGHVSLPALGVILVVQASFQLVALVLMFLPASTRWYRPNHSSRPPPSRDSPGADAL